MDSNEFVQKNFKNNVNEETLNEVTNFFIIWQFYEKELFDAEFKMRKINDDYFNIVKSINVEKYLDEIFIYIKKKYLKFMNKEMSEIIYLHFKTESSGYGEEKIKEMLNSDESLTKFKLLNLLIFRVRNNMFHGEKDVYELNSQKRLFEICNTFLIECLKFKNKYYI